MKPVRMRVVVLAGGSGTRLWPLSRASNPKQLTSVIGGKPMVRLMVDRLRKKFRAADIFISTGELRAEAMAKALPMVPAANFIFEPCARGTAAAVGFCAAVIEQRFPGGQIVFVNADTHVTDDGSFLAAIADAGSLVAQNPRHAALLGMRPTRPETGYGYIKAGQRVGEDAHAVEQFVEKPDLETAKAFCKDRHYLWNPSTFVLFGEHCADLFAKHLPVHAKLLPSLAALAGSPKDAAKLAKLFARLPSESIDKGVWEKESRLLVLPVECGWTDIGSWQAVHDVMKKDSRSNAAADVGLALDGSGNLLYGGKEKMIAVIGLSDIAVVDAGDALVVCPLARSQEVKKVVEQLRSSKKLIRYA